MTGVAPHTDERRLVSDGGSAGWRADRVTFLDMAGTEAVNLYGHPQIPNRTVGAR